MNPESTNRDTKAKRQPNVVLILTDDQGWGDLSRTGNTQIATPHCDRLAQAGATMEHFYVQPLCAPTRAEILTGRYYPWTGVRGVTRCAERLRLTETTIAQLFKASGYVTGCFGKWHSGLQYPFHPKGRGFDDFYGYCCGHWSHYFDSSIEDNGKDVQAPGYLTDALTDRAMQFIEQHRDEPFFCYVPLNTPHSPWQVPDKWFDKFKDVDLPLRATHPDKENMQETRTALAMCENIDWNVGRIVDKLDQLNLSNDTIVVYLSDNGPNTWRYNGNMVGKKGSCQEGGVRSPCSITWPGHIPGNKHVREVTGGIDLLPTLTALAGVAMDTHKPVDGLDLSPLLLGNVTTNWPTRGMYAQEVPGGYSPEFRAASLRMGTYRGYEDGRVYDLASDISETNDLSTQLPEVSAEFKQRLADWRNRLPIEVTDMALPVGYTAYPMTYLPAQDATPHGKLRFSSVHPNCSWLMDWQDTNDTISWHIRVQTAGRFAVTLMYACPEADLGSTLELRFKDDAITTRITEAFDPMPLSGFDRSPRDESPEKAFKPIEMGEITLSADEDMLVLRCLDIPGKQACQVRSLKLTLLLDD